MIIETKYGKLEGTEKNGIYSFLGIPYAAAPVGDLRFRPPLPPKAWAGVRKAERFGAPALQLVTVGHIITPKLLSIASEDCLYLNVRTNNPNPDAKLPVYIFFHGGAYDTGGSNMKMYEGLRFAEDGIVYVNINYRLGPLASLALETLQEENGVTGCLQILDQMQAVRWVHENIEAFGGDPENVTIGGESAGAFSVSVLMCMPEMKGMFRRCIMESGSIRAAATSVYYGHGNRRRALEIGHAVLRDLSLTDTAADVEILRSLPAEQILRAWYFRKDGSLRGFRSNPVLDGLLFQGDLLPDPRIQKPHAVDLLFGYNTDEGSMFADQHLTPESYRQELRQMFPEHWDAVLKKYPPDAEHSSYQRMSQILGLQKFKGSMLPYAEILSDAGCHVYAYHFDYLTERLASEGLGVRHIAELPFVFDTLLDTVGAEDDPGRKMAKIMHRFWVTFMRDGCPGENWELYNSSNPGAMRFYRNGTSFEHMDQMEEMLWLDSLL